MKRRIALSGVIAPTISFADFSTLVNNSNTRSTYAPITEEDAKVILGVVRLLPTFESLPSLNIHGKKLILILGKTGAGKSTLLNYLTGTVYKYDEATERMVAQNQERAGTSASKTESHTQIPNVFSIPGSDFCYVDCAGFGDTKGKEYDVLLALFLRRLVKTNTIAHVIWVVSDTTISANRGQTFINQFSALKPLFGPEHHKRLPLTIAVNAVQDPDNVSSLISGLTQSSVTSPLPHDRQEFKAFSDVPSSVIPIDFESALDGTPIQSRLKSVQETAVPCRFEYAPADPDFIARMHLIRTSMLEYSRIVTADVDDTVSDLSRKTKSADAQRQLARDIQSAGKSKTAVLEVERQSLESEITNLAQEIRDLTDILEGHLSKESEWVDGCVRKELHSGIFSRGAKEDIKIPGWVLASHRKVSYGGTDYSERYQSSFDQKSTELIEIENLERRELRQSREKKAENERSIKAIDAAYSWYESYSQADRERVNTLKAENKELAKKIKYLEGVLREGRRTEIEKEQFGRDVSIHIEAYRDREAKIEYKRAKRMVPKEGGLLEDIYDKHSVRRAELERQKNEKQLQLQVVRLNIEKEKMSTLVQQDAEAGTAVAFEARIDAINTRIAEIEAEIKTLNEKWQSYSTKIHTVGEICIPFLQATHQMADNRDLGQYLGAQALNTLLMAPLVSPDFQIDVPESHGALWAAWTGLLISLAPIRGEFRKICDEWVGPDSNLDVLSLMLTYNRIDSHVLTTSRIASAIPKILDRMIGELNVPGKIEQLNLQGITASVDGLKTMNTFNEQVTTLRLFSEIMDCSVTFLDRDHLHRTAFIRDRHGRPAIHIEVKDGRIYAVLPHIIRTEFNHLRTDFEASAYGAAAKAADTARQISVEPILSRLSGSEKISSDQLGRLFKTTAALNSVKTAETLQDIEWISHELVEMAKASHRLVYLPPESTMNLENFGVAIRGIPHTPSESGQWILAPVHIGHLDFYTTDTASEPSVSEAIRTYAILHALKHPLQGSGAIRCKDGVVTISFLTEGNTLLIQKSART